MKTLMGLSRILSFGGEKGCEGKALCIHETGVFFYCDTQFFLS